MTDQELRDALAFLMHVWDVHGQEVCEELMHRALTEEERLDIIAHGHGAVEEQVFWRAVRLAEAAA